jgi:hypothetical protein
MKRRLLERVERQRRKRDILMIVEMKGVGLGYSTPKRAPVSVGPSGGKDD